MGHDYCFVALVTRAWRKEEIFEMEGLRETGNLESQYSDSRHGPRHHETVPDSRCAPHLSDIM